MDIDEIRRLKLLQLIDEAGGRKGGQKELAAALSAVRHDRPPVQPDYISRLKMLAGRKGRKRISGDMARDLERAMKKPPGWMDAEDAGHKPLSPSRGKSAMTWPLSVPFEEFEKLSPRAKRELDEAFTRLFIGTQTQDLMAKSRKKQA